MGTHPIFESDFDCLTECFSILSQNVLHPSLLGFSLMWPWEMQKRLIESYLNFMTMSALKLPKTFVNCALVKEDLDMKVADSTGLLTDSWHKAEILLISTELVESPFMVEFFQMRTLLFVTLSLIYCLWLMLDQIQMDLNSSLLLSIVPG